jgi:alpha-N-arabinofuranosidase
MKYVINVAKRTARIDKNIYGHFSEHLGRCIYEGLYVGENSTIENIDGIRVDVLNALKAMKLPILRWPGGNFADEYHWKDGIGPKEKRKKMINTHWGGVVEDNSFGTHEFLQLCELIGCEPYINGNVGSGTVQEMSEWMEYMTFSGCSPMAQLREDNGRKDSWNIKYFGIGNENWGCGGNMRPEYYADLFRRFGTYVRNYGDNKVFKVACGPNADDYNWTDVLMKNAGRFMEGLSLHYYTVPNDTWEDKGAATGFDSETYYKTLKKTLFMEELITKHSNIMDQYDADKRVALIVDEWGTWYNVEEGTNPGFLYQQNSMRDALVAGINLNIFNKNADRVRMANIAQLVNVLQSVILTEGEKMILTPTYHVFEMYSAHQENKLLDSYIESGLVGTETSQIPDVIESASIDKEGNVVMTLCNTDINESKIIDIDLLYYKARILEGECVSGNMNGYNTFENPTNVVKKVFDAMELTDHGFRVTLPPCSVVKIIAKG